MKKLISKESWIGGVSDGLILPCSICGIEHIQFDYSVNNDLWQKVVPKEYILSVVCLPCLDKLAKKAGLNIGDHIESLQFIGINETIEFIPSNIFYYNRDKEWDLLKSLTTTYGYKTSKREEDIKLFLFNIIFQTGSAVGWLCWKYESLAGLYPIYHRLMSLSVAIDDKYKLNQWYIMD